MPTGIAISENFADLLDSRFRKIYTDELEENIKESMVPMVFGMETLQRKWNPNIVGCA